MSRGGRRHARVWFRRAFGGMEDKAPVLAFTKKTPTFLESEWACVRMPCSCSAKHGWGTADHDIHSSTVTLVCKRCAAWRRVLIYWRDAGVLSDGPSVIHVESHPPEKKVKASV